MDKFDQAEKDAEDLLKKVYGIAEDGGEDESGEVVVETPVAETPTVPVTETEPTIPEVIAPVPTPEAIPTDDSFEKKYKTLEGKYNAEVPRLAQEKRELKEKLGNLETQVEDLKTKLNSVNAIQQSTDVDESLKELEEYNPSLAEPVKKLKVEYEGKIAALESKIEKLLNDKFKVVETDIVDNKKVRFDTEMNSSVPDWATIDTDPNFIKWLEVEVPYTHFTKLQYLQEAGRKYDAKSAAKFFLDYKAEMAKFVPQEPTPSKIEKFIAPPKGNNLTPLPNAGQTVLTKESYEKFMRETAKNKFNPEQWGGKTEAEVEAIFDVAISKGELK